MNKRYFTTEDRVRNLEVQLNTDAHGLGGSAKKMADRFARIFKEMNH